MELTLIGTVSKFKEAVIMNDIVYKLLIEIVTDLENTREDICGYSYVRTIRNILIGKEDAIIAPNFKNKRYYGVLNELTLGETERLMDYLVKTNQLTYIYTQKGKLYCTFDYYKDRYGKKGRFDAR